MTTPKVTSTTRAKVWRRLIILFQFTLVVYSPVSYADATQDHSFGGQVFALLSGALLLWWGVVGVIRTTREDDGG